MIVPSDIISVPSSVTEIARVESPKQAICKLTH